MKILLSTPPGKSSECWPPLGLLYLASSLKKQRGDKVRVFDAFCLNMDSSTLVSEIEKEAPDVLGMNCSTHMFLDTMKVVSEVKMRMPDITVILGGYHPTFTSKEILASYEEVDFIVRGEGELVLPQLLDFIEKNQRPYSLSGVAFRDGRKIVQNEFDLIRDLDSLPFPDRHLVADVEYGYSHLGVPLTFGKLTTICSSRGCPHECTYCSCSRLMKKKYRERSPSNVIDELIQIESQGYKNCIFVDDNFTLNRKRVIELCRLIRRERLDLRFYAEGRVDRADISLLKEMKKAGFEVIYFGAESASARVLSYYKKGCKPDEIRNAIRNAKKAGLLVVASFIIGAPIENHDDVMMTLDLIEETYPHAIQINILDCLVGTPMWENFDSLGLIGGDDWKTNHRIFEYPVTPFSKEELDTFVRLGYSRLFNKWKKPKSLLSLFLSLTKNRVLRNILFYNLRNPAARQLISNA